MIDVLFKVLGSGLELWSSKEATKYVDKIAKLKKEYHHEINQPIPDDNRLDIIRYELRIICEAFSNQVRAKNS